MSRLATLATPFQPRVNADERGSTPAHQRLSALISGPAGFGLCLVLLAAFASSFAAAQDRPVTDVWLDIDPATAIGEIDDGFMLIQAFHSPEVRVRGVSVVFGNSPLKYGRNIAYNIVAAFGPEGLAVHEGAASAEQFGEETAAVRAMVAALQKAPMTILAVGPVTNVGTLVKLHPELHERIEAIVVVAGRRPGQRFVTPDQANQDSSPPDFNFECDVPAMQAILDTQIPFVMAPWEVGSHVWITHADVVALRDTGPTGLFLYATSLHRLQWLAERRGMKGAHPYDTLAVGWITHPELIESMRVEAVIEQGPDPREPGETKPMLHVREIDDTIGRTMIYLTQPSPRFKEVLLERLE